MTVTPGQTARRFSFVATGREQEWGTSFHEQYEQVDQILIRRTNR